MKKKIIISAVILVVITGIVLGFTIFGRNQNNQAKYKKEAAKKGSIEALVVTTGTLNPVTVVDVGSQVSGRIEKMYVDFNSQVKAGQLIAEIDQSSFISRVQQNEANYLSSQASVEKSKLTLENAKKKYERALNLFDKDLISFEERDNAEVQYFGAVTDLQSAEARLEQAKSQLDTSKIDLAYTIIKSPIDGIIITRNVNVGQTVAASFSAPVLFKIANDLSKMQVECSVDESDIGKVSEGQKVRFTVDAFPNEQFSGKVSQVRYSPEIAQNVVTYTTIVEVGNPEMKLRPGMTATVSIVTGEAKDKLLVPNAALRFQPQLSPEEMKKIFDEVRNEMQAQRPADQTDKPTGERQETPRNQGGQQFMGMGNREQGGQQGRMRNSGLVWIENEKAQLRPVWIRTGVTDNSFTEVVAGNLKEGQEVITGVNNNGQGRGSNRPPSGMMFMRR